MKSPATIYVVHHPNCKLAAELASSLFQWFRLGYFGSDSNAVGLPIYYRRSLSSDEHDEEITPKIPWDEADLSVIIVLVDHQMVVCPKWRSAVEQLANKVVENRKDLKAQSRSILLPVVLHDSFYRTDKLYKQFNPVRLLNLDLPEMKRTLRRATTEAIAREIRIDDKDSTPAALNVFLSHAKRDGTEIAESIRDGIRRFSQMEAWYDANNLAYGRNWESPMTEAAEKSTAALIAAVTDAYPTRPWCRREARLARTPVPSAPKSMIWQLQPVVAVSSRGSEWVRGAETLAGVPTIGWNPKAGPEQVARILDRLVLEILLIRVHVRLAEKIASHLQASSNAKKMSQICFISWIPDVWTLAELRFRIQHLASKSKSGSPPTIKKIVYPGHGMTKSEERGLLPIISTFHKDAELVSFEDAWE